MVPSRGRPVQRLGLREGDELLIVRSGHAPGAPDAAGLVLEVLDDSGEGLYRVRWHGGVETIFRPGHDVVVRRRARA